MLIGNLGEIIWSLNDSLKFLVKKGWNQIFEFCDPSQVFNPTRNSHSPVRKYRKLNKNSD